MNSTSLLYISCMVSDSFQVGDDEWKTSKLNKIKKKNEASKSYNLLSHL